MLDLRKMLSAMFFLCNSTQELKLKHIIQLYRYPGYQENTSLKNEEEINQIVKDMVDLSLSILPVFAMQASNA